MTKLDGFFQDVEVHESCDKWIAYRGTVRVDEVTVPILFHSKNDPVDGLLITYNGAIQRSKAPDGIVFQRSSWLQDFDANVLQLADPTMCLHRKLQIGWGQYTKNQWAIDAYAKIVSEFRDHFDLAPALKSLHYGSSAGGFQAACVSALDRESKALVNNPQLDWSRYVPAFVNALLRDVFDGEELNSVIERVPWRVNALKFFEYAGYTPELQILVNLASEGDFVNQLKPFLDELPTLALDSRRPRLSIEPYCDGLLGHNPLPKPYTIMRINETMRPTQID